MVTHKTTREKVMEEVLCGKKGWHSSSTDWDDVTCKICIKKKIDLPLPEGW